MVYRIVIKFIKNSEITYASIEGEMQYGVYKKQ